MSIPGLALLYAGLAPKRWAVNTMTMAFSGFSIVLIVWLLWGFNLAFGNPIHLGTGLWGSFLGHPASAAGAGSEEAQATIPLVSGIGAMPDFRFPQAALVYFQFVFAAITPLLFLGSIWGRFNLRAWLIFVPLWSTLVYSLDAFLLWGGGFLAQHGAVDYSGGYVIHLSAGVSGFVAAAIIGPRLMRDRVNTRPHNLAYVALGAGILWLGWNGFNGGDPYFAGADAAAAVLNTNVATAAALLTWLFMDMSSRSVRKPTFAGAVNGMVVGLVAITPAAGYVNGYGALAIGVIASFIVWFSFNKLSQRWIFKKVDDAFGVVHTHGVAGLLGGVLTGVFADPRMVEYIGTQKTSSVAVTGLLYGHPGQVLIQLEAAGVVIAISAVGTLVLLKLIGLVVPLRYDEATLREGDLAIHDEEIHTTDVENELDEELSEVIGSARKVPDASSGADDGSGPRVLQHGLMVKETAAPSEDLDEEEPPPVAE